MIEVVCIVLTCVAAAPGRGLPLPNPSFEIDANDDGIPDGWTWRVGTGRGKCELVQGDRPGGNRCVKITGLGHDARVWLESPSMKVKPGQSYVFSCWAKSEGITSGKPVLGIARWNAEGKWDNWSYGLDVPRNRDWAHYRQVFTMLATTARAAFRVWVEFFQGVVWFDDVALEEYHAPKPGWIDRFEDLSAWRTSDVTVSRSEGGLVVRQGEPSDPLAILPRGCVEREVDVDVAKHPCLSIDVARKAGLWAIRLEGIGYAQHHTSKNGSFYYDLRRHELKRVVLNIEVAGGSGEVCVKHLAFLPDVPPHVQTAPVRRSRYVTPDVTLDGLKRGQRHPFVAISREEVERIKRKGKVYETWLAGVRRNADRYLKQPIDVPVEPCIYSMRYNCPTHGVPLRWQRNAPNKHQCPKGDHIVTGAEFDREWRIRKIASAHRNSRRILSTLGQAYAFTQDERYARRAREMLVEYTRKFPDYPYHSGRGEISQEGTGMRVELEPLGEAGWLAAMARGYDLVASSPAFSQSDHAAIKAMFAQDAKVSLRYDEGLSNRQAHHNLALASVGLILGDDFLIRRALGSLRYQLKHAVLGDGMWWECSPGYHFYAVRTLRDVAETFHRAGIDELRDPKLRLAFDGPLRFLLPDGQYPAVNDAHLGMRLRRSDFEMLYHRYRDPVYAGLLAAPGYDRTRSHEYLAYGDELGQEQPLPNESWNFFQAGMSVMRTGDLGQQVCAVLDYGQTVAGHGHMDKLNLVLFAHDRLMMPDIGTRSYFSPVYRFWDRQTLSHNTVVIDERSQKQERGRLTLFDGLGPVQVVQATADEAYPCVNQKRTLFVTPDYVVDLFRVTDDATAPRVSPEGTLSDGARASSPAQVRPAAGSARGRMPALRQSSSPTLRQVKARARLSLERIREIPYWTKQPWGTNTPESLRRDLARFERSRDAHTGNCCAMIAQSGDVPAAWTTEIRRLTGPNRSIRRGVIAVEPGGTYELSGWVKTRDATGVTRLVCAWLGKGTRRVGDVRTKTLAGTNDWTQLTARGRAPSSAKWAQIQCVSSNNAGTAWFDDLALVPDGGSNVLAPNGDFELEAEPHKSVDYVLHGFGDLSCETAAATFDGKLGEDTDEPTFDGRNSYRFFTDVKAGSSEANWTAQWREKDTGLRVHMLAGTGTRVFTGMGQGPGSTSLPMLMARRREANTMFAAVLDPFRGAPDVKRISALRSGIDACGVAVETRAGRALFAASFGPGRKQFGQLTLDGAVGSVGLSVADAVKWLYLVDGTALSYAGASLKMAGSYHVTIVDSDDGEKTIGVREQLPVGEALKGGPLVLDLPYNECYAVKEVTKSASGSLIHLDGLPNLYLRSGMTATIAARAFVRFVRRDLIEISSNGPLDVVLPRPPSQRRVHIRDAQGRIAELPVRSEGRRSILHFVSAQARTLAAFGLDSSGELADSEPPRVTAIAVDGQGIDAAPSVCVPFRPRTVVLTLAEASGIDRQSLSVSIDGKNASPDRYRLEPLGPNGKRASLTVRSSALPISSLSLSVQDASFLRNALSFRLDTAPPFEIVAMRTASGGHVARLLEQSATLQGEVTLAKGQYEVNVISRAYTDGANSLWLDLDGRRMPDAVHLPTKGFGNSSNHYELPPTLSRLTVEDCGEHTFVLSLREGPGPELDRIQFLQDGQVVCELECEALRGTRPSRR